MNGMIDIDLSNVGTNEELATILKQEFPLQTEGTMFSVNAEFEDTVWKAGTNCTVLSSLKELVRESSGEFYSLIKGAAEEIENAIAEIVVYVGYAIKSAQDAIKVAVEMVDEAIVWVGEQIDSVVDSAVGVFEDVIDGINSVVSGVNSALAAIRDAVSAIIDEMATAVKNFSVRACSGLRDAVEKVGTGGGLDRIHPVTYASDGEFAEATFSGFRDLLPSLSDSLNGALSQVKARAGLETQSIFGPLRGIDTMLGKEIT